MKTIVKSQRDAVRDLIGTVEDKLRVLPGALVGDSKEYLEVCPLKHTFVDGAYVREIFMPKGLLLVTKIHKIEHPYFIMKGDVSVLTTEGAVRLKAPHHGITKPNTKRLLYMHEDTIWITVHVTDSKDLSVIEDKIISKDFSDEDIRKVVEDAEAYRNNKQLLA